MGMNRYQYIARANDGTQHKGFILATDRKSVVHAINEKGLVLLSVQDAPKGTNAQRKKPYILIATLAFCVAVLCGNFWYQKTFKSAQKTEVKERAANRSLSIQQELRRKSEKSALSNNSRHVSADVLLVTSTSKITSGSHAVFPLTNTLSQTPPRQVRDYPSGLEQVLSWIVNKQLGDTPFILPRLNQKEEFAKILERDLIVYDNDSEKSVIQKANVAQAKQMLKTYLAQGGNVEDFLSYYHTQLLEANRMWRTAQNEITALSKTGEPNEVRAYAQELNKKLAEKGIKSIRLPKHLQGE